MTKGETIIALMKADWASVPALMEASGWNHTSVRGFISAAAKKHHLTIERKRENGITSYRATNGVA